MINNHEADMVSFWNSYEQAATSFIAKEPDRLSWIMADYARRFCEGFRGADILEIGGGDGLGCDYPVYQAHQTRESNTLEGETKL